MSTNKQWDTPPAMQIDTARHYQVDVKTGRVSRFLGKWTNRLSFLS